MGEPDDTAGEEHSPNPMSFDLARDIRSWAKTIDRWTDSGEECFLVTEEGLQPTTPADVAAAITRLRKPRRTRAD